MPDIQEILRLHLEASERLGELLEECRRLRDAGKVREARRALAQAEELRARLKALEKHVRRHE